MRHVTRYSHRIFTFQRESCLWLPSIHTSASMAAGCCLIISLVIFSKHARFIIRWELSSSTRFRLSTATVAASYIESFLSRPIIQRKPFKLGKLMIRNSSIIPMMITMMCDASGTNFYFAIASDVLICSTRKYCSSFGALPIWLAFCQTRTRRMLSRHVQIFKIIHWNDVVFVDIYNIVWCKRGFIVSFFSIYARDSRNLILLSHTIYFDRWIPELHTIHFNANYRYNKWHIIRIWNQVVTVADANGGCLFCDDGRWYTVNTVYHNDTMDWTAKECQIQLRGHPQTRQALGNYIYRCYQRALREAKKGVNGA